MNTFLAGSRELRQLTQTARDLAALQRQYQQVAPAALLRASRVQWFESQVLILAADNAAVAAKLRQLAPQLALQLRQMGAEVTGIQVRVQVGMPPQRRSVGPRTLSSSGRQHLGQLAGTLADSPLKRALQRLARKG